MPILSWTLENSLYKGQKLGKVDFVMTNQNKVRGNITIFQQKLREINVTLHFELISRIIFLVTKKFHISTLWFADHSVEKRK